MIRVTLQPEPTSFDQDVRRPGARFLANRQPGQKLLSHWRAASRDLYQAYSGICAYTCMYMLSPGSLDHFIPKSSRPDLAYEWTNFRLCTPRVNQQKSDSTDIIDPFVVRNGDFVIDLPSCLVKPADGLPTALRTQVLNSIHILKLNRDDSLVQERCEILLDFARGHVSQDFLNRRYPFLALEIMRQGLDSDSVAQAFKHPRG